MNEEITSGPIVGSRKIYVQGKRYDFKVGMREILLSDTLDTKGCRFKNEPITVYDTSGPYTDDQYTVDLQKGLPQIRKTWIEERGDVDRLPRMSSEYGNMRMNDTKLDHLRFEHVNTQPLRAKEGQAVSQMAYARQGIITPEMEPRFDIIRWIFII